MYKINLAYFSCRRDLEMLKISLLSGRRNYIFNKVFVFSDPFDPILEEIPGVEVIQRKAGSQKLYGLNNIEDMHRCLRLAAEDCDYVLKKDSDVFDCSSVVYDRLNENTFDAYGAFPMARENLIPPRHFNGNAYFIKSSIIQKFPEKMPDCIHNWAIMNYPEDMVTSAICNTITKNIQIDGTAQSFGGKYLFDIFLSRIITLSNEEIQKYGFAHCRSNERIMRYLESTIYGKHQN